MPDGATTLSDLAAAINVTTDEVESWFRDPHFRGFLIQELDARSAVTVSLLWRMIGKTALEASRPETRLECAKLYLARFDPGLRAGVPDAAKSIERFAEDIAQRAVAAALPKPVTAVVQPK